MRDLSMSRLMWQTAAIDEVCIKSRWRWKREAIVKAPMSRWMCKRRQFMGDNKMKTTVRKTSFEEEQRMKDEAFLRLSPSERLRIHEDLRKRIWGSKYNKLSLKGMSVRKKQLPK